MIDKLLDMSTAVVVLAMKGVLIGAVILGAMIPYWIWYLFYVLVIPTSPTAIFFIFGVGLFFAGLTQIIAASLGLMVIVAILKS